MKAGVGQLQSSAMRPPAVEPRADQDLQFFSRDSPHTSLQTMGGEMDDGSWWCGSLVIETWDAGQAVTAAVVRSPSLTFS